MKPVADENLDRGLVATLAPHECELNGAFSVVTPRSIRIRRRGPGAKCET